MVFRSARRANSITGQKLSLSVLIRVAQIIAGEHETCNHTVTDLLVNSDHTPKTRLHKRRVEFRVRVTSYLNFYSMIFYVEQMNCGRGLLLT